MHKGAFFTSSPAARELPLGERLQSRATRGKEEAFFGSALCSCHSERRQSRSEESRHRNKKRSSLLYGIWFFVTDRPGGRSLQGNAKSRLVACEILRRAFALLRMTPFLVGTGRRGRRPLHRNAKSVGAWRSISRRRTIAPIACGTRCFSPTIVNFTSIPVKHPKKKKKKK